MFMNHGFSRAARGVRFLALAAVLAASVPASFSIGVDQGAQAQQSRGGGGGRSSDGGGSNPVLKCLGPDCIDVSKAQIPCTHNYCEEKKVVEYRDSCEIQVCDIVYGEKICWLERPYDLRTCKKQKQRL